MLEWKYIHKGYYHAVSNNTGEEYVVRTRPKNDGWMAIAESDGLVMATGLTLFAAEKLCEKVDDATLRSIFDI